MPKTDLTSTEVAKLVRVPDQTIDLWLRQGIITCDVPATGTGTRRRFTLLDLTQALLAASLTRSHRPMAHAAALTAIMRAHWPGDDPGNVGYILVADAADPLSA